LCQVAKLIKLKGLIWYQHNHFDISDINISLKISYSLIWNMFPKNNYIETLDRDILNNKCSIEKSKETYNLYLASI
jgi:hypothetical protein